MVPQPFPLLPASFLGREERRSRLLRSPIVKRLHCNDSNVPCRGFASVSDDSRTGQRWIVCSIHENSGNIGLEYGTYPVGY